MKAVVEARRAKREIQAELSRRLNAWHAETGFTVDGVRVTGIEVTSLADSVRRFRYEIHIDCRLDGNPDCAA